MVLEDIIIVVADILLVRPQESRPIEHTSDNSIRREMANWGEQGRNCITCVSSIIVTVVVFCLLTFILIT